MTRNLDPQQLVGSTALDRDGEKLGKIGSVYLSDDTGDPEWMTVKTGMFGHKESFVPLQGAVLRDEDVVAQVPKQKVSDAPQIDADGHLSTDEGDELYRYYGLQQSGRHAQNPGEGAQPAAGAVPGTGRRKAAPGEHAARGENAEVTRSEERLRVGTESVETGHVRLRKYVVTEEQEMKVPVRHEEVRVEREPIERGEPGEARIEEGEQEVTLHAEKPVVNTETVPVEKVRLDKQQVTEEETVHGQVRREEIDVDDDTQRRR
ncbi:DUF2382 domain-containing protein [Amycolatopsis jiangsuensis]|uniref:Uncharacterized protein (TIGR02271 family) n=1 Tax=Amycolatopsis jiangsuensis TaxID=1181879 RepID=A0A840J042_9PSEU|nr:PRC and DUF2382 domain-containing protein [Amycolatopsis jiangsuensis]MBB4686897.1 uncharacterized protein (TIGR02271 family) [Amycolatopsis jiangsuensis]